MPVETADAGVAVMAGESGVSAVSDVPADSSSRVVASSVADGAGSAGLSSASPAGVRDAGVLEVAALERVRLRSCWRTHAGVELAVLVSAAVVFVAWQMESLLFVLGMAVNVLVATAAVVVVAALVFPSGRSRAAMMSVLAFVTETRAASWADRVTSQLVGVFHHPRVRPRLLRLSARRPVAAVLSKVRYLTSLSSDAAEDPDAAASGDDVAVDAVGGPPAP